MVVVQAKIHCSRAELRAGFVVVLECENATEKNVSKRRRGAARRIWIQSGFFEEGVTHS